MNVTDKDIKNFKRLKSICKKCGKSKPDVTFGKHKEGRFKTKCNKCLNESARKKYHKKKTEYKQPSGFMYFMGSVSNG